MRLGSSFAPLTPSWLACGPWSRPRRRSPTEPASATALSVATPLPPQARRSSMPCAPPWTRSSTRNRVDLDDLRRLRESAGLALAKMQRVSMEWDQAWELVDLAERGLRERADVCEWLRRESLKPVRPQTERNVLDWASDAIELGDHRGASEQARK